MAEAKMTQKDSLKFFTQNIAEITDAAKRMALIRRDLVVLDAEIKAKAQIKRMIFAGAALMFLNLTLILGFFWVTFSLFESGWRPGVLAVFSFLIFGFISAVLGYLAYRVGQEGRHS